MIAYIRYFSTVQAQTKGKQEREKKKYLYPIWITRKNAFLKIFYLFIYFL